MKLKFYYVRKEFLIVVTSLLFVFFSCFYLADQYRFSGPQHYDAEVVPTINFFKEKCSEHNIKNICDYGFKHLVRADIVNGFLHKKSSSFATIGLAEFSVFSKLTKISIDSSTMSDSVLFESTIIHELGHAILYLEHDDSKLAIMNTAAYGASISKYTYKQLVDEMFVDFKKNLN